MSRREPTPFTKPEDGSKVFWRSLAEKSEPEAAHLRNAAEFPEGIEEAQSMPRASAVASGLVTLRKKAADVKNAMQLAPRAARADEVVVGRRGFLAFGGASAALLAEGCARRPVEKIFPYAKMPEHVIPGVSTYYASVYAPEGDALGVIVESHEGRPTKLDGNPDHPASGGGSDAYAQVSLYGLYDPDRTTTPMKASRAGGGVGTHMPSTWAEVEAALSDAARIAQGDQGAKLRFLVQPSSSPTFLRLRDAFLAKYPKAVVHVWSSLESDGAKDGAKLAFGQPVHALHAFDQASVIVSIDSDFLGTEPGRVRNMAGFAKGRRPTHETLRMNRLYVVEPAFTVTGMNADHRLRVPASQAGSYLAAIAKELSEKHGVELGAIKGEVAKADTSKFPPKWIAAVAKDLASNRAKSVVVAGARQPAHVHALAHALNAALGNVGHTVSYAGVLDAAAPTSVQSVKQLADDMAAGKVGTLIVLGGNPVYDAPADLKLGERIRAVASTFHVGSHLDETGEACAWHIPAAHPLEAWGDARSFDGTVAIQQPLIAPLHGGKSDIEILARFTGEGPRSGHDLVQTTLKLGTRGWNEALKKGVVTGPEKVLGNLEPRASEIATAWGQQKAHPAPTADNLEVTFAPCPKVLDGRYANNPLLLELPDPVTKVTWDNVALISVATAEALGLENRQLVRLSRDGAGAVEVAVWITPGQADNVVSVVTGWGRQKAGRYGNKRGFDVGALRTSDALWIASGVKLAKLTTGDIESVRGKLRKVDMPATESPPPGRVRPDDPFDVGTTLYKVSVTQEHGGMEGRPIAVDATLDEYRKQAFFPMYPNEERRDIDKDGKNVAVREKGTPDPNVLPLWHKVDYSKVHKWGMSIDLSTCTGCNACVVACQVENNVPAVGKESIERGREMYWLRIDRYFVGLDHNDPQIAMMPVACVHCEEAPCENVCPVNATEHSPEGLNDMAYNRCIGTRYCANNCPYKVRRFNFLNYHTNGGAYEDVPEVERMKYNPNVTVRMRGTMEKCTYCVQRIQEAKIQSKRTGKPIKDGDIVSACSAACPTSSIFFGDLNDPESRVAKARAADRGYRLLAELGTGPRTTHLGKIRNPNPEMV